MNFTGENEPKSPRQPQGIKVIIGPKKENLPGITRSNIKRLARRAGIQRIGDRVYDETERVLKSFLEAIVRDATQYTEFGKRKIVSALDVTLALKRNGRNMLGFEKEFEQVKLAVQIMKFEDGVIAFSLASAFLLFLQFKRYN